MWMLQSARRVCCTNLLEWCSGQELFALQLLNEGSEQRIVMSDAGTEKTINDIPSMYGVRSWQPS